MVLECIIGKYMDISTFGIISNAKLVKYDQLEAQGSVKVADFEKTLLSYVVTCCNGAPGFKKKSVTRTDTVTRVTASCVTCGHRYWN